MSDLAAIVAHTPSAKDIASYGVGWSLNQVIDNGDGSYEILFARLVGTTPKNQYAVARVNTPAAATGNPNPKPSATDIAKAAPTGWSLACMLKCKGYWLLYFSKPA